MTSGVIAAYFGIGLFLVQFMHTFHASSTYGQKQVRGLEYLPNFSRMDPPEGWEQTFRPLERPFQLPWNVPIYQMQREHVTPLHRLVGLHATNLYYCYLVSVLYGLLGGMLLWALVPDLATVTWGALVAIGIVFAGLHMFSFALVGSGFTNTLLEGTLMFNVLVLLILSGGQIEYTTAISLLQFGAALTVGPLVFWLHFQYNEGLLRFGNLFAFYYILVPVLYAEFFVLALGLLYK